MTLENETAANPANTQNRNPPSTSPIKPWRIASNERYREVVRMVMGLAAASLVLPAFIGEHLLPKCKPLPGSVLSILVLSWGLLVVSILAAIVFHYLSAKWIRLAWGREVRMFRRHWPDESIEALLNWSFWATGLCFVGGLFTEALILFYGCR